jgi:hypothetical protein
VASADENRELARRALEDVCSGRRIDDVGDVYGRVASNRAQLLAGRALTAQRLRGRRG